MNTISTFTKPFQQQLHFAMVALFGCCVMTLASCAKIPCYPVSFTMQTFAVLLIGLTQTPKQAFASVLLFLFSASIGVPVFCGHANPLWLFGNCGGYLVAFPIAAYLTSQLKNTPILAIFLGQLLIYSLGFLGLVPYFGLSAALLKGVVLFIPSDLLKMVLALSAAKIWKKLQ